jgi:hypothetical protein
MTKQELTEAYHQLAAEAMTVQRRVELQRKHREFFDNEWRIIHDRMD